MVNIGTVVAYLLNSWNNLDELVGEKIYPYYIENEIDFPAVVYKVDSITPQYDKGNFTIDEHLVEVISFAPTYIKSLEIRNEVRNALEFKRGSINGVDVVSIRVKEITEDYDFESNVFYSKINFLIKTQ